MAYNKTVHTTYYTNFVVIREVYRMSSRRVSLGPVTRLSFERRKRGLSVAELSKLTGIYPTVISQLELGYIRPYPKYKRVLSEFFGIPEDDLFQVGELQWVPLTEYNELVKHVVRL